jgi:hypothetical protein
MSARLSLLFLRVTINNSQYNTHNMHIKNIKTHENFSYHVTPNFQEIENSGFLIYECGIFKR